MVRILIHGCGGTMGRVLADMAQTTPDIEIAAGVDPAAKATEFTFPTFPAFAEVDQTADVIIDFSTPETLKPLLDAAVQMEAALIIATTGHTEDDKALMQAHAQRVPIFHAANMSLGINLMSELIHNAAAVLGERFDVEIIEKHHNLKKDAPSGTAYVLADAINKAFMNSKKYVFGRHTRTERRQPVDIGIHAVRGGTIVGEHQVLFAGKDEILKIAHNAYSKQVFATGALQAARFMAGKTPGLYSMKDMIDAQSTVSHMYTSDEDALVSIYDMPNDPHQITEVFKKIGEEKINLDMISQTAPVEDKVSISFTQARKDLEKTVALLKEFQTATPQLKLEVLPEITKITVVGPGMEVQSGVAAQVFDVMAKQGIALKTVTTSETKISYIIPQADRERAIEAIKTAFEI
jgi:4-hydroxy-tetrahydrodipicolinate reductase